MTKYRLNADGMFIDGIDHPRGAVVELADEERAKRLCAKGVFTEVGAKASKSAKTEEPKAEEPKAEVEEEVESETKAEESDDYSGSEAPPVRRRPGRPRRNA